MCATVFLFILSLRNMLSDRFRNVFFQIVDLFSKFPFFTCKANCRISITVPDESVFFFNLELTELKAIEVVILPERIEEGI